MRQRRDRNQRCRDQSPVEPDKTVDKGWHADEREHHRKERWYWRLSAILTSVAVAFTFVTVVLGFLAYHEAIKATGEAHSQAVEAKRQADTAQTAYEEGSRAVISVSTMHWKSPLTKDTDNAIVVEYSNVGKDATSVQIRSYPVFNFNTSLKFGIDLIGFVTNETCNPMNFVGGNITAFPSVTKIYNTYMTVKADIINEVIDGKLITGVQGCAFYMDFGKLHWTGFCMVAAKGNDTASDAETPFCAGGNFSE